MVTFVKPEFPDEESDAAVVFGEEAGDFHTTPEAETVILLSGNRYAHIAR